MTSVEQILLNTPTTPIENKWSYSDYCFWYLELCRDLHGKSFVSGKRDNLVKTHIKALGKQTYCWNGEFRFWIWEFWDGVDMLRVFVSNNKGVCLEVTGHTSLKRAMELAEQYRKKVLR